MRFNLGSRREWWVYIRFRCDKRRALVLTDKLFEAAKSGDDLVLGCVVIQRNNFYFLFK